MAVTDWVTEPSSGGSRVIWVRAYKKSNQAHSKQPKVRATKLIYKQKKVDSSLSPFSK